MREGDREDKGGGLDARVCGLGVRAGACEGGGSSEKGEGEGEGGEWRRRQRRRREDQGQ